MKQPQPRQKETSPYTKWERRGSAIAHASGLLVGVPILFLLPPALAFLANPVVPYFIGKLFFRPRRLAWGAFQCMQASVVHMIIVALVFSAYLLAGASPTTAAALFTAAAILFLYTLWGAWDTLLGYDFRYIIIAKFLDRVSQANLERAQRRRGILPPTRPEQDDRPQR